MSSLSLRNEPLPELRHSTRVSLFCAQLILPKKLSSDLWCHTPNYFQPAVHSPFILTLHGPSSPSAPSARVSAYMGWIRELSQVKMKRFFLIVCLLGLASRCTSSPVQLTPWLLGCSHWQKGGSRVGCRVALLRDSSVLGWFELATKPYPYLWRNGAFTEPYGLINDSITSTD